MTLGVCLPSDARAHVERLPSEVIPMPWAHGRRPPSEHVEACYITRAQTYVDALELQIKFLTDFSRAARTCLTLSRRAMQLAGEAPFLVAPCRTATELTIGDTNPSAALSAVGQRSERALALQLRLASISR